MFKRRDKTQDKANATVLAERKLRRWLKVSFLGYVAILVITVVGLGSVALINASNTNPNFCGGCHVMQSHVAAYVSGTNLDHAHELAGVQCKDCHDYTIPQEITAGLNYLTNNYSVEADGELAKRDFGDQICTKCHISMEHVAVATDFLYRNPHAHSDMGAFTCNQCHLSHAPQIDFCGQCHDNGGQRMLGDTTPREEVIGEKSAPPPSPW